MDPYTFTLREDHITEIDKLVGDGKPYDSRSGAMRNIIESYSRVDELQTTIDRLQREKTMILEHREEHTELVTAIQREENRQDRISGANVLTRMKWWFTGVPEQ